MTPPPLYELGNRGFALVAVLWLLVLISALAVTVVSGGRAELKLVSNGVAAAAGGGPGRLGGSQSVRPGEPQGTPRRPRSLHLATFPTFSIPLPIVQGADKGRKADNFVESLAKPILCHGWSGV